MINKINIFRSTVVICLVITLSTTRILKTATYRCTYSDGSTETANYNWASECIKKDKTLSKVEQKTNGKWELVKLTRCTYSDGSTQTDYFPYSNLCPWKGKTLVKIEQGTNTKDLKVVQEFNKKLKI